MMSLRVDVHLCPAVPTAPNTAPVRMMLRSALGVTMIALFPPNSSNDLPNLPATAVPTIFPIRVLPVADISGMRWSCVMNSPTR